ncbi:unnamed protein product [Darwinula stevensoni]|uniref:Uncharacterized protein n=1 Tax=Darwinula stevensoni TaxID=69355 RepID=A0A7R8XLY5_9CRUS|nr:unnamed protein product [Darwinula stevensoni]CAG0894873.1 unnamed protein product [Darwinula stevensoni]
MEKSSHQREKVGVDDFVLLEDHTDENAFLDNLNKRFNHDVIYVSSPSFPIAERVLSERRSRKGIDRSDIVSFLYLLII